MGKEKIGCYWGRFNPPHKGHLNLIKKLLKKVNKLIIVVGSAQEKNTLRNPFSGKERIQMLRSYLREEKINGVKVITLSDKESYSKSVDYLFKKTPKFDILFTDKKSIIKAIGKRAKVGFFVRKRSISSTKIRKAIFNNEKYEHLTRNSVARLIIQFNGASRIKKAHLN